MTRELVTIEFRYNDAPTSDTGSIYKTKKITIGVFDSLDEAIVNGNKAIECLEKHFKVNQNCSRRRRFSKNGGCFGTADRLISPLGFLDCPFDFYAKITTLVYLDVEQTIMEILKSSKRYLDYKKSELD